MTVEQQLRLWADELRAIANEGAQWDTTNPYNARRRQRMLRIAAEMVAVQDVRTVDTIEHAYHADLRHMAPYPCGDAAVFNDTGHILLIQRRDNGLWYCLQVKVLSHMSSTRISAARGGKGSVAAYTPYFHEPFAPTHGCRYAMRLMRLCNMAAIRLA